MLNRLLNQEQSGKTSKGGSTFQKIGKGEGAAAPTGERWLCWSDISPSARCYRKQHAPGPFRLPFAIRLWSSDFPRAAQNELDVKIQIYVHIISVLGVM